MRGATAFHPNHQWDVVILIPAPHEGCDTIGESAAIRTINFNSLTRVGCDRKILCLFFPFRIFIEIFLFV